MSEWTRQTPTVPGCYAFVGSQNTYHVSRTYLTIGYVEHGRWRNSENPEWLYYNGELITNLVGYWYHIPAAPPNQYAWVFSIDSGNTFEWTPRPKD